jgi:hypothetical protein
VKASEWMEKKEEERKKKPRGEKVDGGTFMYL